MDLPFTLHVDEHLVLRQRRFEDAEELFALTEANRTRLREWLPWLDSCTRVEDTRANIQHELERARAGVGLAVVLWYDDRIAGVGGYNAIDHSNRVAHIGYWLGAAFEGRGIMTRANQALVDYGFAQRGLLRQTIAAGVGNTRSRAVAERLGFRWEGVLRDAENLYGRQIDHALYALTRRDWEGARTPDRVVVNGFSIRAMSPSDLSAALALWTCSQGVGMSRDETPAMLNAYLARNPGLSSVAIDDASGRLVGALMAGHDGRRGFLYHLAVEPSVQKRGLGRQLVSRSLAALRAENVAKTSIVVYSTNAPAQAFWEKLGWTPRGDLCLLQKALSSNK